MTALRHGHVQRCTSETDIELSLCLDGSGQGQVDTGVGFFDHMLTALARHSLCDLEVRCHGDLVVDAHHTVEDVGICLGQAIDQALGDKHGIERFGHSYVPMDDALARAAIDLSGRPFVILTADFTTDRVGSFPTILTGEFFRAVATRGRFNLHLDLLRGNDAHHGIESIFKAFGRALEQASRHTDRVDGVPSTKGSL